MNESSPSIVDTLIGLLDVFDVTSANAIRKRVVGSLATYFEADAVVLVIEGTVVEGTVVEGRVVDGKLVDATGLESVDADLDWLVEAGRLERGDDLEPEARVASGVSSGPFASVELLSLDAGDDHSYLVVARQGRAFTAEDMRIGDAIARIMQQALWWVEAYSERREALEAAEWQASHDRLTGMANRPLVVETIDRRMAAGEVVAVLYIDIDRFRSVNDRHGHQVGDAYIRELGTRLAGSIRPDDLCGRMAGDEFIVVCGQAPGRDRELADLADRLATRLSQPAVVGEHEVSLTVSIGLATSDGLGSAADLIEAAELAVLQARSDGRNQTGVYHHAVQHQIRRQAILAERLKKIAATGEGLYIAYQPIVDLNTGLVRSHEALLRLDDQVLGRVGPDEFIPAAEDLGLVGDIDCWVLRNAMREVAAAGLASGLSVNVSPPWLQRPDAIDVVIEAGAATGFPLDRLSLEVTERVALADSVTGTLRQLRELGPKILLDDFGTGYSSLAYVRTLQVDGVKIDRGFVDGVESDLSKAAILEAVVTLTERLGALAIAEGVEEEAQQTVLQAFGCHLVQGFYYGRPTPAPEGLAATNLADLGLGHLKGASQPSP